MQLSVLLVGSDAREMHANEHAIRQKLECRTIHVLSTKEAIQHVTNIEKMIPDLILLDLQKAYLDAITFIRTYRLWYKDIPIVVMAGCGEEVSAMEAMFCGADDYLIKPVSLQRLNFSVRNAIKFYQLKRQLTRIEARENGHAILSDIVAISDQMKQLVVDARRVASSRLPVLIEGAQGTGKQKLARAIHGSSSCAGNPFVVGDCRMLQHHNMEVVLLGYNESPVSNAKVQFSMGKFHEAKGGTLYLDGIETLPMDLQEKVLALVEISREQTRGVPERECVRVIFACAGTANHLVHRGQLHPRVYELTISTRLHLPQLHERKEDIPFLAEHFLKAHAARECKFFSGFTPEAQDWLLNNYWPRNVSQLSRVIWRAVILSQGPILDVGELKYTHSPEYRPRTKNGFESEEIFLDGMGQTKKLKHLEIEAILFAIRQAGGSMSKAAKSLGIGRSTLYRKLNDLEVAA